MQLAWKFGVVALVALVFAVLPGGGAALDVVLTVLTIAFFAAIAFLGYRLFRQYRFELESLPERQRLALYGSIGLALLTLHGHQPPVRRGRRAACWPGSRCWGSRPTALYWVWTQYRSYG